MHLLTCLWYMYILSHAEYIRQLFMSRLLNKLEEESTRVNRQHARQEAPLPGIVILHRIVTIKTVKRCSPSPGSLLKPHRFTVGYCKRSVVVSLVL